MHYSITFKHQSITGRPALGAILYLPLSFVGRSPTEESLRNRSAFRQGRRYEVLTGERIQTTKTPTSKVEPFSGVEIHMEMYMDWKWMEMGHNLWKGYGLVWIWGRPSALKRYKKYGKFIKHDISNTKARLFTTWRDIPLTLARAFWEKVSALRG